MEVHPSCCFVFFSFGTVLYSIRSLRVGNVKSLPGQQNVSVVISNSFGKINVLGMVEILTCGDGYVMYGARRVCVFGREREVEHREFGTFWGILGSFL